MSHTESASAYGAAILASDEESSGKRAEDEDQQNSSINMTRAIPFSNDEPSSGKANDGDAVASSLVALRRSNARKSGRQSLRRSESPLRGRRRPIEFRAASWLPNIASSPFKDKQDDVESEWELHSLMTNDEQYKTIVNVCMAVGKMGRKYGSLSCRVERLLEWLAVEQLGCYEALFSTAQSEMIFTITLHDGDVPKTLIVPIEPGLDLYKLALLSDLVKKMWPGRDFRDKDGEEILSINEFMSRLKGIESKKHIFGCRVEGVSFIAAATSICPVFGGSWWDMLMTVATSSIVYITYNFFCNHLISVQQRTSGAPIPFLTAFFSASLGMVMKYLLPGIDPMIIVVSSIFILLPGFTVSMGIFEMITSHIVAGFANLVQGTVFLFWQVLGAWAGHALFGSIIGLDADQMKEMELNDPINQFWFFLFVPILSLGLVIFFQMHPRYWIWSIPHLCLTLAVSIIVEQMLDNGYLATYCASALLCVTANLWSRIRDQPNTILLVPAIILMVGGSTGFRGLIALVSGKDYGGDSVFYEMYIIALIILSGLLTGNLFVDTTKSTL